MSTLSPATARLTYRALEPVHGMIYFSPHGPQVYRELGITDPRMMYFASRSAAFGPVPAEVTIATFFNFNPAAVRAVLPAAWNIAAPTDILHARLAAADRSLRQAWGVDVDGPEVREAATLARQAAERACERAHGRPLFAAHAALPWPAEPHLVLWHAQTLLREFRGDGHVALLLTEGLSGLEALITHAAAGEIPPEVLRISRSWTEQDWAQGVAALRDRNWLTDRDLTLSTHGSARRAAIETRTDELSTHPYEAIGPDGCERLRKLASALTIRIMDADLAFPPMLSQRYRDTVR
ncbi:hypothetical protein ACFXG4_13770 [Nocardia sp. NPDC059246]|uniref:SCO6745 family protein n=1 Tax=unclassified Nocardia TaxID=2637762 RepID=UPI003695417D